MLTEKDMVAGRSGKATKSKWTWYYNLSDKQRAAENKRLRKEFAGVEKEFKEIEKFQLVTEPFTYKTRGSSLSPNTPPPKPRTTTSDSSIMAPRDRYLSTSLRTVSLSDSTLSISSKASESRRVTFRPADGSVVSSGDECSVPPKRPAFGGRALKYDDDHRPPEEADDTESSAWDSSGSEQCNESRRRHIVPSKTSMLSLKQHSSRDQNAGTSTSLTKAEVIMKRKERIERQRSFLGDIPGYRHRSSSEESGASRNVLAKPASIPLKSYSLAKRNQDGALAENIGLVHESARRRLWPATSLDASPVPAPRRAYDEFEDPLPPWSRPQRLQGARASRASSSTSALYSFREGAQKRGPPTSVWHSTPLESKKAPAGAKTSQLSFSRGPLSTSRERRSHSGFRVLDKGEDLIQISLREHGTAGGSGAKRPSATASIHTAHAGTSGLQQPPSHRDPSSTKSKSSGAANRSTVIRFGVGNNRERVLVSHSTSASSAIASFCAEGRSAAEPSTQEAEEEQDANRYPFGEAVRGDAISQLLKLCGQSIPVTFEDALRLSEECLSSRKLGEGCSADVYLIRREGAYDSVVKVVRVGGESRAGAEKPRSVAGANPEVVIARELSNLRFNPTNQSSNFIELRGVHCVQGPYPAELVRSWKKYEAQFCSENEDPEAFDAAQMYVLFELEHGGKTLDRFKGSSEMFQSVFLQLSCSLAAAESELEFEHRDLHCDNVLLQRTSEEQVRFLLYGREMRLPTAGVRATIIDYTLSRMRKGEDVFFTDLAHDDELFRGSGSYQYDIYLTMQEHNGNNWETYEPVTNVMWLHYLLVKMITKCAPRSKSDPDESGAGARSALAAWAATIRDFPSASAFVAQNLLPRHSPPPLPDSPPSGSSSPSPQKKRRRSAKRRPAFPVEVSSHPMSLRARRT
ncbi:hypothetical protein V5799_019115 [Amblyomma americanum]|uniref:non-specific serine/threonine protein kinase n=1 Tax=Amblyomma americanum TaxID=6943 RepID=A0AAQ4EXA0_AMBAM